ncbi:RING-box protein 1 [Angomonas deanei]|uniref:Anaphase-promoting complex subunit 11 RING-H2 finger/RING-H2 zinc finger domain/Ring finger domain containing protein, putative n=1 Tax=Angomonas deanei TaxID=59799 RepID=A0A7G2CLL1_9TRYP|nr:RING-box protein 1 [Angomonas deanei]CAD2219804.1 Anaphase-promoting complex subunit 11 RING-H2 finger/RING-H2 zinc finger domain/Ring finger domain containing protein, putative [Angomonas deanei]|eukprot:EPY43372.1 RING-box protein 1 [Angomonas deanei]
MSGSLPQYAESEEVFELTAYTPVFVSQWKVDATTCTICRNALEGPCMACLADAEVTSWECPVRWGECQHCFHDHCIQRWLKTREVCPLDGQPWKNKNEWNYSVELGGEVPAQQSV